MTKTLTLLTCRRCGYQWIPRKPRPVSCPDCKHRRWDQVKEGNRR